MKNFQVTQVPDSCVHKRLFPPSLVLYTLLMLMTTGAKLNAQCNCPYVVGTESPSGVSTLSAAIGSNNFPGIEAPGDACVKIIGQFNVDVNWSLGPVNAQDAKVYFGNANSSLFVLDDAVLNAQSVKFTPCSDKWSGVYIQQGGTVTADDCTFDHANKGIAALMNTTFFITNSLFEECQKGVHITGVQQVANHLVSDNQFSNCDFGVYITAARNVRIHGNIYKGIEHPVTGVHTDGFSQNIEVIGGNFSGLYRGVSSVKTLNLKISGGCFNQAIMALFPLKDLTRFRS